MSALGVAGAAAEQRSARGQTFDEEGPLPPGWRTKVDHQQQRRFYYNRSTGETTDRRPSLSVKEVGLTAVERLQKKVDEGWQTLLASETDEQYERHITEMQQKLTNWVTQAEADGEPAQLLNAQTENTRCDLDMRLSRVGLQKHYAGNHCFDNKRYEEAVKNYRDSIDKDPEQHELKFVWERIGESHAILRHREREEDISRLKSLVSGERAAQLQTYIRTQETFRPGDHGRCLNSDCFLHVVDRVDNVDNVLCIPKDGHLDLAIAAFLRAQEEALAAPKLQFSNQPNLFNFFLKSVDSTASVTPVAGRYNSDWAAVTAKLMELLLKERLPRVVNVLWNITQAAQPNAFTSVDEQLFLQHREAAKIMAERCPTLHGWEMYHKGVALTKVKRYDDAVTVLQEATTEKPGETLCAVAEAQMRGWEQGEWSRAQNGALHTAIATMWLAIENAETAKDGAAFADECRLYLAEMLFDDRQFDECSNIISTLAFFDDDDVRSRYDKLVELMDLRSTRDGLKWQHGCGQWKIGGEGVQLGRMNLAEYSIVVRNARTCTGGIRCTGTNVCHAKWKFNKAAIARLDGSCSGTTKTISCRDFAKLKAGKSPTEKLKGVEKTDKFIVDIVDSWGGVAGTVVSQAISPELSLHDLLPAPTPFGEVQASSTENRMARSAQVRANNHDESSRRDDSDDDEPGASGDEASSKLDLDDADSEPANERKRLRAAVGHDELEPTRRRRVHASIMKQPSPGVSPPSRPEQVATNFNGGAKAATAVVAPNVELANLSSQLERQYFGRRGDRMGERTRGDQEYALGSFVGQEAVSFGEIIGNGSFSQVCEGRLNGSTVAIKSMLDSADARHQRVFYKELQALQTCGHRNILKLIGYCDVLIPQQRSSWFLVTELMHL